MAWGLGAGGLYLAAMTGAWWWPIPVRLLYDGFSPPPPYRWVRPPSGLNNLAPEPGTGPIALPASGSSSGSIVTDDGQAGIIFPPQAIEEPSGESSVTVTITALDPASLPPPPSGLRSDGNAYRVEASYASTRKPLVLRRPVTVVLRYPMHATTLLKLSDSGWVALKAQTVPIAFQVYADTRTLGVFVAAGPPQTGPPFSLYLYRVVTVLLWAAIVLVLVGLLRDYLRHRARQPGGGPRR